MLDDNNGVICYKNDITSKIFTVVFSISNTKVITYGTPVQAGTENSNGYTSCKKISSTDVLCAFEATTNKPYAFVAQVSGLSVTSSSTVIIDNSASIAGCGIAVLSPTTAILATDYLVDYTLKFIIINISGSSITVGNSLQSTMYSDPGLIFIDTVNENSCVCLTYNSNYSYAMVVKNNNGSISFSPIQLLELASSGVTMFSATIGSSKTDERAIFYRDGTTEGVIRCKTLKVT